MNDLLTQVSKIKVGFGGASVSGEGAGYGFGDISETNAIDLIHYAFERGIRIFDTAPIYGFGTSEERIGKAFKSNRDKVFIISKSGVTWHPNMRVDMSNDPKVTEKMLHESLKRIDTDYIDLFMIHWPDAKVDIRKTMEVLAEAKHSQKIKHIGLCNTNISEIEKAQEVDSIEVVQNELNLFNRSATKDLIPYVKDKDISFMSWGTFDKGIITGRANMNRKYDKSDARSWAPWWKKSNKNEKMKKMENILELLEKKGHTGAELALAHNLSVNGVSNLLCGFRSKSQLDSVLKSLKHLPSDEIINEVIELSRL